MRVDMPTDTAFTFVLSVAQSKIELGDIAAQFRQHSPCPSSDDRVRARLVACASSSASP